MRASALKYTILTTVAALVIIMLVLLPFHAFLTVWLSSNFGHYTAWRLWKEVLLALCALGGIYLLFADRKIRTHTLPRFLVRLIILYLVVQLLWGVIAYHNHAVSKKALAYGLLVNMRFLMFFFITWGIALRTARLKKQWQKVVLWPAAVVVAFGLLQVFVLPRDFLSHFGYGPHTITPYETINHNAAYIRIASTLRGANPLGAYLLLPLSAAAVLLFKGKRDWRKALLLAGGLVTLFFSFSRGAWVGAVVSAVVLLALCIQSKRLKLYTMYAVAALVVIAAGLTLAFRNNTRFQNIVWHTQTHTTAKSSSDEGHVSALKTGIRQVLHNPLGRGPGTAGPASVYNNHPARIAENYYVQMGQETGWLGLALFVLINAGVGYLLWLRRSDPLALMLFSSFVGISVTNLFSHEWTDDTLSYIWWGLAGVAMASLPEAADDRAANGK